MRLENALLRLVCEETYGRGAYCSIIGNGGELEMSPLHAQGLDKPAFPPCWDALQPLKQRGLAAWVWPAAGVAVCEKASYAASPRRVLQLN